ncbi:MAG: glycosyltransferase [Candidatus Komeilibacteria bacterium]|jgi:glycosyltransferase involved in cell wall biosynthesis|nr:glycosyltransferase [Candidatus Komeilibacteria bacterium]
MKLFYISNSRIPTEKAHGIQIMKMCEAFTRAGIDLHLILPNRKNHIKDDPFDYYKIKNKFKITYLSNIDLVGKIPRFGFWLQSFTFAWSVKKYLAKNNDEAVVYSRDILPLFYILKNKKLKLFYEIHNWSNKLSFFHKKVFAKTKFSAISNGLKKELLDYGIEDKNILISPDGVDLEEFVINISREECRQKLKIDSNKKIVLYTGHLYRWKGVYEVLPAAALTPEVDFYFIGGTNYDINKFDAKIKDLNLSNVHVLGHKPYDQMPYYMKAADILLLPNSKQFKISRLYTSPMKLFEYMASNTPIVASDLPSIREILNEQNSILVDTDDKNIFSENIKKLINNVALANSLAEQAKKDVQKYSWQARVKNILNFINNVS